MKFGTLIGCLFVLMCMSGEIALQRRKKRKANKLDMQIIRAINETYRNSKSINKTIKQINICNNNNKPTQCNNTNTSSNNNNNNSTQDNHRTTTQYVLPHVISYPPMRFPATQQHVKPLIAPCYLPLRTLNAYPYVYDPVHACHLCCYNSFFMNAGSLKACYSHCSYSDIIP